MTLDKRIKQDLEDLYNNGEIRGAVELDGLVEKENEGIYWVGHVNTSSFSLEEKKVVELLKSNSGISIEQLAVQAKMTVKDLQNLLNNLRKKGCANSIKDEISFATRALPIYTGGKRGAKTVMVMLNPGKGVKDSNKDLLIELKKRSMFTMLSKLCCGGACQQVTSSNVDLTEDINNYNYFNAHYGDWDCNRHDNFDLKQAFFLRDWPEDSEVGVDKANLNYIIKNNKIEEKEVKKEVKKEVQKRKLEEKRKVLNDKQQLELVPYASRSFSSFADKGKKKEERIKKLCPYVETLLHEIFSQPRKYVIFCSSLFDEVFKVYNKESAKKYRVEFGEECKHQIIGEKLDKKTGQKKIFSTSCTPITISNLEGKSSSIKAIIANTFPSQALPNAYEKMAEYGKFCYECYCGMHSSNQPHSITLP